MTTNLALVTGGAHRLGKEFALSLARMGYDILLHYYSSEADAQQTKSEIESLGRLVFLLKADLTKPEEIESLFAQVDSIFGLSPFIFSVLVNSAAVMHLGRPADISLADWDESLGLNLRAPFILAREAAKRMTEGGLIVNIVDVGAQKAWSRYAAYTVSKAGLESLTKVLARALAPSIRVNAIAPGLVLQSDVVSPEGWDKLVAGTPLKRAARPEEISSALEFLVRNKYVTGQTIVVDGGYSLI